MELHLFIAFMTARCGICLLYSFAGYILDSLASRFGRTLVVAGTALFSRKIGLFLLPGYLLDYFRVDDSTTYIFRIALFIFLAREPLRAVAGDEPVDLEAIDFVRSGIPLLIYAGTFFSLTLRSWLLYVACLSGVGFLCWSEYIVRKMSPFTRPIQRLVDKELTKLYKFLSGFYKSIHRKISNGITNAVDVEDLMRRPPFIYSPLKAEIEIRLLCLYMGVNSEIVSCGLLHVPLEDAASYKYDAISYTWGDNSEDNSILVNGCRLPTSSTVHEILQNRRSHWRQRYIWIDSICINQNDKMEKSSQVQVMTNIYKQAARVVVWLGTASDASLGIELFKELQYMISLHDISDDDVYERYIPEKGSPRWYALGNMFESPWFERVWVVQEVAVASEVHIIYGGVPLRWSDLLLVVRNLHRMTKVRALLEVAEGENIRRGPLSRALQSISIDEIRGLFQNGEKLELQNLLTSCFNRQATDGRDMVYALNGLCQEKLDEGLNPDYSISVCELFTRTARSILTQGASLQLLCHAGIGWARKVENLPSWAPDWTSGRIQLPYSSTNNESVKSYRASSDSQKQVKYGPDSASISVTAVIVDEVSVLGLPFHTPTLNTKSDDDHFFKKQVPAWLREARSMAQQHSKGIYGPNDILSEAIWRTIVADSTSIPGEAPRQRPAPAEYGALYDVIDKLYLDDNDKIFDQLVHMSQAVDFDISQWMTDLAFAWNSRRFCVTKKGYIGLVPLGSAVGDRVSIILGAQTPSLLRLNDSLDTSSDKDSWSLVGECYFHGMMDGEAFDPNTELGILAVVEEVVLR